MRFQATKRYDRAYFDKWYRSSTHRVHDTAEVRRKVSLAVTTAEYFLRRPVESVIDVGCGEGAWFHHLAVLKKRVEYTGIDPSAYVVERFGRERNIRKGSFSDLRSVRGKFDLVVCSDVIHYLTEREIERGLPHLERITEGLAFIEVLTSDDDILGDVEGLIRRSPAWYRRRFANAGFVQAAPYCWLTRSMRKEAAALEIVG